MKKRKKMRSNILQNVHIPFVFYGININQRWPCSLVRILTTAEGHHHKSGVPRHPGFDYRKLVTSKVRFGHFGESFPALQNLFYSSSEY